MCQIISAGKDGTFGVGTRLTTVNVVGNMIGNYDPTAPTDPTKTSQTWSPTITGMMGPAGKDDQSNFFDRKLGY